jgi:hypothetical protein
MHFLWDTDAEIDSNAKASVDASAAVRVSNIYMNFT